MKKIIHKTIIPVISTILLIGPSSHLLSLDNTLEPQYVSNEIEQVVADVWDAKATQWDTFVGDDGERDLNRRHQSDPALQKLLGDIVGKVVLDAGCGTGYLARRLYAAGAHVIAVDISPEMINVARSKPGSEGITYLVDSVSTLSTIKDYSIDAIVANYVLMDTPSLKDALDAFFRVLKPGGRAVIAFLHPCFPLQSVTYDASSQHTEFHWDESYFNQRIVRVPPWTDVFSSDFMVFHRPISVYFKEFRHAGFNVVDMVEPVIEEDYSELPEELVKLFRMEPISIIFLLQKP